MPPFASREGKPLPYSKATRLFVGERSVPPFGFAGEHCSPLHTGILNFSVGDDVLGVPFYKSRNKKPSLVREGGPR